MKAIKDYRSTKKSLPDELNWALLVADGVVLNKDGSLSAGFYFRGEDLSTASDESRNNTATRVNRVLAHFGTGWMFHIDAVRLPAVSYPDVWRSHFPDLVTQLIDDERREAFAGEYYQSEYALVVTYLPPKHSHNKLLALVTEEVGRDESQAGAEVSQLLESFEKQLADMQDQLGDLLVLSRMKDRKVHEQGRAVIYSDLLSYLHFSLTGRLQRIRVPDCGMYVDALIGAYDYYPGLRPRLDEDLIQVVAIEGFPSASYPNILAELDQLPIHYRWTTRFIPLDDHESLSWIESMRRKWAQKQWGFWSIVMQQPGRLNRDAAAMTEDAEQAIAEASSGTMKYGFYTATVVLRGTDPSVLEEQARMVLQTVRRHGFAGRVETVNTDDALFGSLPGHGVHNVRRPLMHTQALADLLPLSAVWAGEAVAPCPMLPAGSPPLFLAATTGATPYYFNLHDNDVGHTLVIGPTGAGKSTLGAFIAAQFRRYKGARVVSFDKGNSLKALTWAVGGQHYDVGGEWKEGGLCFAPLARIDEARELAFAADWVESLLVLQGVQVKAEQRNMIGEALKQMAQEKSVPTLSGLSTTIQDREMKEALDFYTESGALGGLLDSEADALTQSDFACFEIEQLMNRDEKVQMPVLLYLFHTIERMIDGKPGLLILDEAWLMLGHPVFREKIREWLKVLRKANWSVLLMTQSVTDASKSGILDVLVESCPTKIFLANRDATESEMAELYKRMGCNSAEIQAIADMTPKREYFIKKPAGKRVVNLNLGAKTLAFVGVSDKDSLAKISELSDNYGNQWTTEWLSFNGLN